MLVYDTGICWEVEFLVCRLSSRGVDEFGPQSQELLIKVPVLAVAGVRLKLLKLRLGESRSTLELRNQILRGPWAAITGVITSR